LRNHIPPKSVSLLWIIFYISYTSKTKLLLLALLASAATFAQTPNRCDVVITKTMADPSPVAGLPNAEFIEIKNVSATAYNLSGWAWPMLRPRLLSPPLSRAARHCSHFFHWQCSGLCFLWPGHWCDLLPFLGQRWRWLTLRSPQNRTIQAAAYTDW
jgi:hypothetical protein